MIIKSSLENILKTSLIAGSINFISTVYFVANVIKIDYGSYLIIFGIFAFAPRILQGIDDLVVRFNHETKKRKELFLNFSLTLKFSLTFYCYLLYILCLKIFFNIEVNFLSKYKTILFY